MIGINLIPDVKQELLRAQRQRNIVVSFAVVIAIGFVALVVVMAILLGGQALADRSLDGDIKRYDEQLKNTDGLSSALTIQSQLASVQGVNDSKLVASRMYDLLTAISPGGENQVKLSRFRIDPVTSTITIEGRAVRDFAALEVFKKTILGASFSYKADGETHTMPVTENVSIIEQGYGDDAATGNKALTFAISFVYPVELFAETSRDVVLKAPQGGDVTDSRLGVPDSLFASPTRSEEK